MSDALDAAARALTRRDRSEAGVLEVLRRKGVAEDEALEAVETLRRVGAVDDERFAVAGGASLAERGYGDAAIAFRLEREGVSGELAERAVSALEQETERARQLVTAAARRRRRPGGWPHEALRRTPSNPQLRRAREPS